MRSFGLMLLAGTGLLTFSVTGQEPATTQSPKQKVQFVNTEDGGVREVLESIAVPPKTGAPFTLTLETEWQKQLYDGGTVTYVNKRRIARDAAGRVYQERWALTPKNDDRVVPVMTVIQIADPNAHTLYNCFLVVKTDTCELLNYTESTSNSYKPQSPKTGPLPEDRGSAVHESLGKQLIAGVETEGTHDVLTYNPGVFGNDRKVTIEQEFWWSPQVGLNLLSIRTDPRIGKQTFKVTSLIQEDPDPSLFELPAGFKVVDHRQTPPQ